MSAGAEPAIEAGPLSLDLDPGNSSEITTALDRMGAIDPALVLLFGAPGPGLDALARQARTALPADCALAGCSTAGEIGLTGYVNGRAVAVAFPSESFRARSIVLHDTAHLPVADWLAALRALLRDFRAKPGRALFGILLADGLAGHEDVLVSSIEAAIPGVPVIGGSAGDGLDFARTTLIADDTIMTGAAVFVLVETALSVSEVAFAHFSPTRNRAVVTAADSERRLILELNAEPAAEEYARIAGLRTADLTPTEFARHPLMFRSGKRHHVRAIRGTTPEGGLQMMSPVATGMVLTMGRAEDLTLGFAEAIEALPRPPLAVLGFDCILRRLALERAGLTGAMSQLFARYRVTGFSTYGEQHSGMHVNQTFVGFAFMPPADQSSALPAPIGGGHAA
ncbi:FIST C-terminal domain-containing protein (plasmid) [Paracoccus sp. TK19116]|uniref:FIST C-terminal domain-containing protein n=1 Tax=Paracoccus albicereus TaxID=2922394 RepID=A0ABT1MM01_9RHOB|nr:FIST N-terminal domain-containing protein [Paracoccus albicereus]MCQ0969290.1 FIST C-terminal domain-containing protein [Paracoccus albicereus]